MSEHKSSIFEAPVQAGKLSPEQMEAGFKKFIGWYDQYEIDLTRSSFVGKEETEPCLITFGVTGAGKSTTVARILHQGTPEEFKNYLKIADPLDKYSRVPIPLVSGQPAGQEQTVAIGHAGAQATTIIPCVYPLRGATKIKFICDMPGFQDPNQFKQISIEVLTKCFLTRVKQAKYLVIVDISTLIEESHFRLFMDQYIRPLQKAFGDHVDSCIKHLYFIFTRAGAEGSLERIRAKASTIYEDLANDEEDEEKAAKEMKALKGKFLMRMKNYSISCNLDVDDSKSMMDKIEKLIAQDKANNVMMINKFLTLSNLDAGGNELVKQCENWMGILLNELEIITKRSTELTAALGRDGKKIKEEVDAMKDIHKEITDKLAKLEAETKDNQHILDSFESTRTAIEEEITKLKKEFEEHKDLLARFRTNVINTQQISFRCDASIAKDKKTHALKVRAVIRSPDSKEDDWVAFILPFENKDDTLATFIGRGGILIPEKLEVFRNFKAANVIYNTSNAINPKALHGELLDQSTFTMEVKLEQPFKLYIYTSRKFADTPQHLQLQNTFEGPIKTDTENLAKLQVKLENHLKKNKEAEKTAVNQKQTKQHLDSRLANSVTSIKTKKEELKTAIAHHKETIESFTKNLTSLAGDKIVSVSKIDKILKVNLITSNLEKLSQTFHTRYHATQEEVLKLGPKVTDIDVDNMSVLNELIAASAAATK